MDKTSTNGTLIHGIAASEHLDSSGERIIVKGMDISSLEEGSGVLNWEHKNDNASHTIGKILKAKKIYSEKDCEDEHQIKFWNKCKMPFVYIVGELFDGVGHEQAKEVAAMLRYDAARRARGDNVPNVISFSVEGAKLDKDGQNIVKSIARKVTCTLAACNKSAIAEQMLPTNAEQEQDSKSPKNLINGIFKSEEAWDGEGISILEVRKSELEKGAKRDWKKEGYRLEHHIDKDGFHNVTAYDKESNPVGYASFTYDYKPDPTESHLVIGDHLKGWDVKVHPNHQRKGLASAMYDLAEKMSGKKILQGGTTPEGSAFWEARKRNFNKSLTAGSATSAPSTLTGGAALGKEDLLKEMKQKAKFAAKSWPEFNRMRKHLEKTRPELSKAEVEALATFAAYRAFERAEQNLAKMINESTSEPIAKAPSVSDDYTQINWPQHPSKEGSYEKSFVHKPTGIKIHKYAVHDPRAPKGFQHSGSIYAITDGDHNENVRSALFVEHQDPETGENSPRIAAVKTWEGHEGQGLSKLLHRTAIKEYGSLKSDYRLSPGSQAIWESLEKDPSMKVQMGPVNEVTKDKEERAIFPQETQHVATWSGAQKKSKKLAVSEKEKKQEPDFEKFPKLSKPYASEAQRKWAHTAAGKKALGGEKAVRHWDVASRGKKLPEKVDKAEKKDRCWEGYEPTPGKKPYEKGSCKPIEKSAEKFSPKFRLLVAHRPYACADCGHAKEIQTNHTDDVSAVCPNCSWKPSEGKTGHKLPALGTQTFRRFEYVGDGSDIQENPHFKKEESPIPLKKEQYNTDKINPLHGWISPQGKYIHMGPEELHARVIDKHGFPYEMGEDDNIHQAVDAGWIAVGTSGENSVQAHPEVIGNKNHPATRTLRKLTGKYWDNFESCYQDHFPVRIDSDLFSKHGIIRSPEDHFQKSQPAKKEPHPFKVGDKVIEVYHDQPKKGTVTQIRTVKGKHHVKVKYEGYSGNPNHFGGGGKFALWDHASYWKHDMEKAEKKDKPFHGYSKERHARTGGLNAKFREKYNREHGSKLKAPVTEKSPTGKRATRKKSFCARMSGVPGPTSKEGKLTPKGAALKRWRCSKSEDIFKDKLDLIKKAEEVLDVDLDDTFLINDEANRKK